MALCPKIKIFEYKATITNIYNLCLRLNHIKKRRLKKIILLFNNPFYIFSAFIVLLQLTQIFPSRIANV